MVSPVAMTGEIGDANPQVFRHLGPNGLRLAGYDKSCLATTTRWIWLVPS